MISVSSLQTIEGESMYDKVSSESVFVVLNSDLIYVNPHMRSNSANVRSIVTGECIT